MKNNINNFSGRAKKRFAAKSVAATLTALAFVISVFGFVFGLFGFGGYSAGKANAQTQTVIAQSGTEQSGTEQSGTEQAGTEQSGTTQETEQTDTASATIEIESPSVIGGKSVDVKIDLKNSPGVASVICDVTFDQSVLTLNSFAYGEEFAKNGETPPSLNSPLRLCWSDLINVSGNKTFATLNFTAVKVEADCVSAITLTYEKSNVINLDEEDVEFAVKNGELTIKRGLPGDINGDGEVNAKDLIRLRKYFSGWEAEVDEVALDVNGDGEINAKDLIRLRKYFAGWNVEIFYGVAPSVCAHSLNKVAAVAATCTAKGNDEYYVCEKCNKIFADEAAKTELSAAPLIEAKGHAEQVLEAVAPTCTQTGLTAGKICSVCNTVLVEQEIVSAKGHVESKVEVPGGNCTLTILYVCDECGHVRSESIESHNYVNRYLPRKNCLIGARSADVCTVCGKEINVVPAEVDGESKEHTIVNATYLFDEEHIDNPCVCEAKTIKADICTVCHETIEIYYEIPARGHKFGEWTVSVEPTETTEGILTRRCTVCANSHIDDQDPLVYKVIPAIYVLDADGYPTSEVSSYYTYVCGTDAPSCSTSGRTDSYKFLDPNGGVHEIKRNVKTWHLLVLDGKNVEINTAKVLVLSESYGDKVKYIGSRLTCDEAGVQGFFKCEECGKNIEVKVRSEHVAFSEDLQTEEDKAKSVAPTCTTKGVYYYHCSGCGSEVCVTVPALGHDVVCSKVYEPTADDANWVFDLMCRTCGETLYSVVSEKEPTVKEEAATCTKNAYTVYTDIVIGKNTDGTDKILIDDDGKPVEIRAEKAGTVLGHHSAVLDAVIADNALIDLRDEKNAAAFDVIGVVNCLTAGPEKTPGVGFYKCDRCGTNRPVKVYVSHKGETKITKYTMCTENGEYTIVKCDDCKQENKTFEIPALGHEKIYTITKTDSGIVATWKCVRKNLSIVADPTDDDSDHTKVVETVCDAVGSVEKTVKSYAIIIKSTCKDYGKARLTYEDGSTEVVMLERCGHMLNGEEIICAYNHPYSPDKEGINYTGDAPTCKDFAFDDAANGYFKCDICVKWVPVYVNVGHKKPASFDPTDEAQHKDATCTEDGYDKYVCAGDCGNEITDIISALGHDVEYKIDLESMTFTVGCKREGCAFNGENNALTAKLPAISGVLCSEHGKVVVNSDVAMSAGYNITVVAIGTCSNAGIYKFTLTNAAYKSALVQALKNAGHDVSEINCFDIYNKKIEFEISLKADHDIESSPIVWVNDGYRYTGKYCQGCGSVVIVSVVKIG